MRPIKIAGHNVIARVMIDDAIAKSLLTPTCISKNAILASVIAIPAGIIDNAPIIKDAQ